MPLVVTQAGQLPNNQKLFSRKKELFGRENKKKGVE